MLALIIVTLLYRISNPESTNFGFEIRSSQENCTLTLNFIIAIGVAVIRQGKPDQMTAIPQP